MELSEIIEIVSPDLDEVEREIEDNIKSEIPLVYDISKYILGSGGKRIRPCVLLLSNGACGLSIEHKRIASAAAIELIHTATLLHDDVVDDAELRRGNPSSNLRWGNQASVLVGDFMLAKALNLIYSCGDLEIFNSITLAAAKLAEGQVLEVMSSTKLIEFTEGVCMDIIKHKTASFIECCGQVGAILAQAPGEDVRALGVYGHNLGIAFQATDDALDYGATEDEFGKKIGQDLMEGKMTLPLVYSLSKATESEKTRVFEILETEELGDENSGYIFDLVECYNGVEKSNDVAGKYVDRAKDAISALPANDYKDSLIRLADFIKERRC